HKAAELKPHHRDVIRNYIRNYHMVGMVSKRYEYVKLMKDKYPYRLYNNEYEMALQEYELYTSNWTLDETVCEMLENNSYNPQSDKVLFVLNKALPVINGYTVRSKDRKSTRLNSSHVSISYAVFCLKKKKKEQ